MPAFINLGFEDAGALPGMADGWTWTRTASTAWAGYARAGGGYDHFESFITGWNVDDALFQLESPHINRATYAPDAQLAESFERGWNNDHFLFVWDPSIAATYDSLPYETFDTGWGAGEYISGFTLADLVAALYEGVPRDSFESGWVDNYKTEFDPMTDLEAAVFRIPGSTAMVEDFEGFMPDQAITVTTPSTINAVSHGYSNGAEVKFFTAIDDSNPTSLPAGLSDRVPYYVKSVASDSFEVSATPGGASVVMTTVGGGAIYVRASSDENWTGRDGDTMASDP